MGWVLHADAAAYEAAAGHFLRSAPVEHTVALGALSQGPADSGSGPPPTWASLRRAGAVVAVAWRTPPFGVGVTALSEQDAEDLAVLLAAECPGIADSPSVAGPTGACAAVAGAIARAFGLSVAPQLVETLYRLDAVGDLVVDGRPAPPGLVRTAEARDVAELVRWLGEFVAEAGTPAPADPHQRIAGSVADATMFVWDDGAVRSFAGGRPTGAGVARIGPVYTPPSARGTGVGTALVAGVCRALFARGLETVTLFADDTNATSTGIYRRMGFRPVLPWTELRLRAADLP